MRSKIDINLVISHSAPQAFRDWVEAYAIMEAYDWYEANDWVGIPMSVESSMQKSLGVVERVCDLTQNWVEAGIQREMDHLVEDLDGCSSAEDVEEALEYLYGISNIWEAKDLPRSSLFALLDEENIWEAAYGGEGWAAARDLLYELENAKTLRKKWGVADRLFDLEHNTGLMMCKTPLWVLGKDVLNVRFNIPSMAYFFEDFRETTRKAVYYYYKHIKKHFNGYKPPFGADSKRPCPFRGTTANSDKYGLGEFFLYGVRVNDGSSDWHIMGREYSNLINKYRGALKFRSLKGQARGLFNGVPVSCRHSQLRNMYDSEHDSLNELWRSFYTCVL